MYPAAWLRSCKHCSYLSVISESLLNLLGTLRKRLPPELLLTNRERTVKTFADIFASVQGNNLKYSEQLRQGVAEILTISAVSRPKILLTMNTILSDVRDELLPLV
jgi:hypothetical protein